MRCRLGGMVGVVVTGGFYRHSLGEERSQGSESHNGGVPEHACSEMCTE